MIAIKLENVSKQYRRYSRTSFYLRDRLSAFFRHPPSGQGAAPERTFWALKDVSFEVKKGEALGIIGRNGAGKSTILKLLAQVSKPTSGTVFTEGRIAPLIEVGAGFHPELSGRENVYLNGSILGMTRAQIERSFDDIVRFAELEDFIDMPVKHYSSGMYVRLGFAIAAHTNPDIYLIDEVLAVGDIAFQQKCLNHLATARHAQKTLILVSHNLPVVETFSQRCIYLDTGQIRYDGPPSLAIAQYLADSGENHKEGEILELSFFDASDHPASAIRCGDDLVVQITYSLRQPVPQPAIGLAILGPNKEDLLSFTSAAASQSLPSSAGTHTTRCRISRLMFAPGTYSFSVSLHTPGGTCYDYHGASYPIHLRPPATSHDGQTCLYVEWQQTSSRHPHD